MEWSIRSFSTKCPSRLNPTANHTGRVVPAKSCHYIYGRYMPTVIVIVVAVVVVVAVVELTLLLLLFQTMLVLYQTDPSLVSISSFITTSFSVGGFVHRPAILLVHPEDGAVAAFDSAGQPWYCDCP